MGKDRKINRDLQGKVKKSEKYLHLSFLSFIFVDYCENRLYENRNSKKRNEPPISI
jgi:hypothetical protein